MSFTIRLDRGNVALTAAEEDKLLRKLDGLEQRLQHHPAPSAVIALEQHALTRQVDVDLRVQLSPLGSHLVSRQSADTIDHALRLAIKEIERQLERNHGKQRGEPSFGVPSRRRISSEPAASTE